jgi:hypothetical protein
MEIHFQNVSIKHHKTRNLSFRYNKPRGIKDTRAFNIPF